MDFPKLIKEKRLSLGESQRVFGLRFKRTSTAVSLWEKGERQAPYEVLSLVFGEETEEKVIICPTCKGEGQITLS